MKAYRSKSVSNENEIKNSKKIDILKGPKIK